MKKILYYISFTVSVAFSILVSCTRTDYEIIEIIDIPYTYNLNGDLITINDSIFFPEAILFTENYLVIFDDKNTEFLRIFDLNGNIIARYGSRGKGPGEFSLPNSNDLYFSQYDDGKGFWITDIISNSKYFLELDSIIKNKNYIPERKISLLTELIPADYSYVINDSLIIGSSSATDNGQLFFWNPFMETLKKVTNYPNIGLKFKKDQMHLLPQVYSNTIKVLNDNIVVAYTYFKIVDIYSLSGNLKKRIKFKDQKKSKFQIFDQGISTNECELYFIDVVLTQNHFYALGLNRTIPEIESGNYFPSIYKFDYKGNLISEFKLDYIINRFCVSEKDSTIFGLSPLTEVTKPIVRFKIF